MFRKNKIISITGTILITLLFICICLNIYSKNINLNKFFIKKYPVMGVDVSHYQGEIDWNELSENKISFAFIKATEGSTHVDKNYASNREKIKATGIYAGFYHFFSFDSEPETQAENFITTVLKEDGMLAPVVDIEFYGYNEVNRPNPMQVRKQLNVFLNKLEQHYKIKPIIYTTTKTYNYYIKDYYAEYPLWIRNVYYPPDFGTTDDWTFWQYSDTGILSGYNGPEKYIDLNVFRGNYEQLQTLLIK